jgi:hypothetical protein
MIKGILAQIASPWSARESDRSVEAQSRQTRQGAELEHRIILQGALRPRRDGFGLNARFAQNSQFEQIVR